jgi:hypothetical protein
MGVDHRLNSDAASASQAMSQLGSAFTALS